jgi:hypothetical protein
MDFPIPHADPIRFVKTLVSADESQAKVEIGFEVIPTFGMLIEAVAQSSSAIKTKDNKIRQGVLTTLKNVELFDKIQQTSFMVNIYLQSKINNLRLLGFEVTCDKIKIMTGELSLVLH